MKYHFFYGGFLSQWYPCEFTIHGIKVNCAEQWMMYEKARFFGDDEIASAILKASSPHEQKTLGRCVRGFKADEWAVVARDIVWDANLEKFGQHKDLMAQLQATKPALLVEASPTDRLWGIGLDEYDDRRFEPSEWRGANWLGEVLTAVRDGKPPKWSDTKFEYDKPPPI